MSGFSKKMLWTFVITTLAGACLHFLYDLLPNPVTALFSPVSESLWEHVKIIFWPYLVSTLVLWRGKEHADPAPRLAAMLLICAGMLVAGWVYHVVLGGTSMVFDIGLYVVLMAVGFVLPCLGRKPLGTGHLMPLFCLTVTLGVAVILFTFLPPAALLFQDLSGARTWVEIACPGC